MTPQYAALLPTDQAADMGRSDRQYAPAFSCGVPHQGIYPHSSTLAATALTCSLLLRLVLSFNLVQRPKM